MERKRPANVTLGSPKSGASRSLRREAGRAARARVSRVLVGKSGTPARVTLAHGAATLRLSSWSSVSGAARMPVLAMGPRTPHGRHAGGSRTPPPLTAQGAGAPSAPASLLVVSEAAGACPFSVTRMP